MVNAPSVSPDQVRAARAWLQWNQDYLAERAGVSKTTLNRFEQAKFMMPHSETSDRLRKALEDAGVRFQFRETTGIGIEVVAAPENESN